MTTRAPSPTLAALLTAAAALNGGKAHAADDNSAAATNSGISYRYTLYDEDDLSGVPLEGSTQRYRVIAQQLRAAGKPADRWGVSVTATQEVMSGSSPWFTYPDADGRPQQAMSGATIKDRRRELIATFTRDPESQSHTSFTASSSNEDDYSAVALGVDRSQSLSAATTLGYGASFSHDKIDPTDAAQFDRIDHASKNSVSAFGSLAWVLDRDSVLQTGVQLTRHSGFLSDPYKRIFVDGQFRNDARPDERAQSAWLLRYRRAFSALDAALHLDYRFAWDSWGLHSHTIDAAWYQDLGHGWRIVPNLRYYTQSRARFYAPYVRDADPRYASSDYRLAAYGALSGGVNLRKRWGKWELSFGFDRYRSDADWGLSGSDDAPGLVSFTRMFAGFDYRFD